MSNAMQERKLSFKEHRAKHFRFETDSDGRVATIALNRPDKKNPLTFDIYQELNNAGSAFLHAPHGDLVRQMRACPQPIVAAVDGFCAGAGAFLQ